MNKSHASAIVSETGWLSEVEPAFRTAILQCSRLGSFARGAYLIEEAESTEDIFGLVEGSVKIQANPGQDGPVVGHFGGAGQWFGAAPFIIGGARRINMIAASPHVIALQVSKGDLRRVLSDDPGSWRWLAQLASHNGQIALAVAVSLLVRDSYKRFCTVLLRLAMQNGHGAAPIYCSQDELGDMTNLSRNSIAGHVRKLQRAGVIKVGYGQIVIKDADALKHEAES